MAPGVRAARGGWGGSSPAGGREAGHHLSQAPPRSAVLLMGTLRLSPGLGPGLCDYKGRPGTRASPCPTPSVLQWLTQWSLDHSFKTEQVAVSSQSSHGNSQPQPLLPGSRRWQPARESSLGSPPPPPPPSVYIPGPLVGVAGTEEQPGAPGTALSGTQGLSAAGGT